MYFYVLIVLLLLTGAIESEDCYGEKIVCHPQDCSNQFKTCQDGVLTSETQPTPVGFVCSNGSFVFPSVCDDDCPIPSCSLSQIFTIDDFNALFPFANGGANNAVPNQHAIFNYQYLIDAAKKFPDFACTGSAETRWKELAAFLGETSEETSGWWNGQPYEWGYYFSTELGCSNGDDCPQYCDPSATDYPCHPDQGYFGRGPIQLSWNFNYGRASAALFGDQNILLTYPDLLFSGSVAFQTALWFWMTPQSPKPSCHDVITGEWAPSEDDLLANRLPGFGMTINIVNGGLECGKATPASAENRVQYFKTYAKYFNVDVGPNLYCDKMQSY